MLSAVNCYHPNLWRFLEILKREQCLNDVVINQILGGHAPEPQRRQYAQASARVLHIVRDFNNRPILDYLRGIAHNIVM